MADPQAIYNVGFNNLLGVRFVSVSPTHVEMELDITPDLLQPHGFLHGGVTLSLLETAGSAAACANADLDTHAVFGVHMDVRHKKPGRAGVLHAVVDLDHQEVSAYSGALKQTWRVAALDDEGDIVSEGTFDTKIVSNEYLASKS